MAAAESASLIRDIQERCAALLISIKDVRQAAANMPVHKQQFTELACLVDRMKPILLELKSRDLQYASESLTLALSSLEAPLKDALKSLGTYNRSSTVWLLLLRCRDIFKKIETITRKIAISLDELLPMVNLELSPTTKQKLLELSKEMKNAEFKAAVKTEEVIAKFQGALREEQTDSQRNLDLLLEIADLTGADVDSSFVVREREAIQKEKVELEEHKRHAEAHTLEQVMAFLSRVDIGSPLSRRTDSSFRSSLRRTGSFPIKGFCCRLTGELMNDPVDTTSGYTFERHAIEEWFAQGNKICPVTKEPLESFQLYPNRSVAASIREREERNVNTRLDKMTSELNSESTLTVKESLSELCELLNVAELVNVKRLVERLVKLSKNMEESSVRIMAIRCLSVIAHRRPESKVLITREGGVELAVEYLDNEDAEIRAQGLMALLSLSNDSQLCGDIGNVKECIPRLVALVRCEDTSLSNTADQVLENLAGVSDNLANMTGANYLKPLVRRITQDSNEEKIRTVNLLGRIALTDDTVSTLVQQGVLAIIVEMVSENSPNPNQAALIALQNLSRHASAKLALLSGTDVVRATLKLLRNRQASGSSCEEIAAKLLADLVVHIRSAETPTEDAALAVLTDKENVAALVVLVAIAEISYPIMEHILQILLGVASMMPDRGAKEVMRDAGVIPVLLSHCDEENHPAVRRSTLMLLDVLTQDGNGNCVVHRLEMTHVKCFASALSQSHMEETTAVSGILSNISIRDHPWIFNTLLSTDALRTVLGLLSTNPSAETTRLLENALGVLLNFTSSRPLSEPILGTLREFKTTSILVHILDVGKTGLAKQRAATGLADLSRSTMFLSLPVRQTARWRNHLSCYRQVMHDACIVHGRKCSAEQSFCLVESNAIVPLLRTLGEKEFCADEAALNALNTLLEPETFGPGMKAIQRAQGLEPLKLLLTNGSFRGKESVLTVLEKITVHQEFRFVIGLPERRALCRFTCEYGDPTRKIAASILGNIGTINKQSTYF